MNLQCVDENHEACNYITDQLERCSWSRHYEAHSCKILAVLASCLQNGLNPEGGCRTSFHWADPNHTVLSLVNYNYYSIGEPGGRGLALPGPGQDPSAEAILWVLVDRRPQVLFSALQLCRLYFFSLILCMPLCRWLLILCVHLRASIPN